MHTQAHENIEIFDGIEKNELQSLESNSVNDLPTIANRGNSRNETKEVDTL